MKKQLFWLLASLTLFVWSCTKKPKHLAYIPSNSAGVMALDIESMAKKSLTVEDILKSVTMKDKDSSLSKIKDSGIDFMNSVYLFGSGTNESDLEFGLLFIVKDGAKLEKTVLETTKETSKKFESNGDVKFFAKDGGVIGYKGDVGLAFFSKSGADKRFAEILNTAEDKGLMAVNKSFADNMDKKSDIKVWMDYGKLMDAVKKLNPMASSLGLDDYKDSYMSLNVNFEDGKIVGESQMDGSKDLMDKLGKLQKGSINADLAKNHPGNDLLMAYAMGLNLKELGKQYTMIKGPVDMGLSYVSKDLSYDYLSDMLSGDLLITLNGVNVVKKEKYDYMTDSTYMKDEPSPNYALSLGIADDKKLNPLLDSMAAKGFLVKNGNSYAVMGGMASVFVKPGSLQIVGMKEYADQIALGKVEKISGDNLDILTKTPSAMTMDLTKLKPEVLQTFDKEAVEYYNMITVESAVVKGYKQEGLSSKSEFVVNFKDKKQNSLKSIQQMVVAFSKKAEEKRKQREEEYQKMMQQYEMMDSTATSEVPATVVE